MLNNEFLFTIFNDALKAFLSGNRRIKIIFFSSWALIFAAIVIASIAEGFEFYKNILQPLAVAFGIIGASMFLGLGTYRRALESVNSEKMLKEAEEHARANPHEPQAAWDLARVKLESYLNRNLKQVQWIFALTLLVMIAGFIIIGYGVFRVYQSTENFRPSIVVTVSGILTEFIAATFLLIYKSTMEQARSYVAMLEKINAVGMSIQILDGTKTGDVDSFRVQLAMRLLSLYGADRFDEHGGKKDT
jgi:hypothetical protein